MHNWKHRVLAAMLSLCMLASLMVTALPAQAAEELVNVALLGTASTEDGDAEGNVITHVNDGKLDTNWQTRGVWPSTAVVQLDMGRTISEVVVKLGGDAVASRSLTVVVEYAQNGVTSDLISIGTKTVTLTGDMEARFTLDQAVSATHFFVTLKDPIQDGAPGQFWPCVSEIEIYEKQDLRLSDYNNIAAQAQISATGDNIDSSGGPNNLVDGNTSSLFKFFKGPMVQEQSVFLTFAQERTMDAFVIAFENVGASDQYAYAFTYSILARNGDGEYETIVANAAANRTDNSSQQYKFLEKTYSEIKIVMHSCTNNTGNRIGWPAIAEFEVYGSEVVVADGCISNGKSVHASSGQSTARNITDGSTNSTWRGSYYPGYVDIDLGANYRLDAVEVYTPENGYSQYSIYTSLNGRDFTKLAEKTSRAQATLADGERYDANGVEARIVRVYLEYNSAETAAVINEVRVLGEATGTPIQELPPINVVKFSDSAYADTTVTAQDTYNEVYGIIQRRLGEKYKSWFTLELAASENGYDYFELSTQDGKVHVKGNDGVSLATGINHYLKYYCNVNISQVGDQVTMPSAAPVIEGTVHKETKAEIRYSYNYCTLSYSMAFWGETEWRNELDWLAMNGVNVVLDATAQEEVWRRFLGKLGYTHQEAKDYIAGPAYYAWAYMANLSGFGGPVHDSWFEERTELARKNQRIMRALGMQPVLQGYSGMVPTDITSKATGTYALTASDIISQGNWCSFQRPAMLRTTSDAFDTYAALFYQCQEEVYGATSDFYATDPFHEGGNTGGMNARDISREVLTSMLAADEDAIWIIQAWQGNPTTALLNGLDDVTNGAQHALVLDLYAEKTPHNQETGGSYGDTKEFDETPWLYCMLNNFGGRLGLHGHLDNLANKIPEAFNRNTHIAGIGITPEASVNNPVLYDFFFETIWQDDASQTMQVIDLDTWLDDYATRRYGAESTSANQAWDILKETVYKGSLNNLGQGAPESVVNARPALNINAASTWGNAVVSYDKLLLEEAAELLLEDYDLLSGSKGYMYDLANILQQVLSNSAQEYQKKMTAAYNSRDLAAFETYSAKFLQIIDYMETVTATSEYFLLGRWVEQAKALAVNADGFTKDLYEFNAKALVTTWGSYNQAESGGLKDYSNRQWSGLIGDFYKTRWQRWITARTNELKGESYENSINWFQWEWEWVRSNTVYTTAATPADLETLGYEILEKFTSANPAADASRDVDPTTMKVYAENYQPNNATEGNPDYVKDGNPSTIWHTVWRDSDRSTHYLIFTFDQVTKIDGMRFMQRSGKNGLVTKYDLMVRTSENDEWTTIVDDGTLATDTAWQLVEFNAVDALQVKFQVVDAMSGEVGNKFAAAAEVRFTVPKKECKHESYTDGICDGCGAACDHSGNTNTQYTDNGDGTHSLTCSVCNGIAETADHSGGEATCEKGKLCDACGIEYTDALGHAYGEPVFAWTEDNTASATVTCANDKTHVVELEAEVTSSITTEADCVTKEVTTYVATVTFEGETYTDTKTVEGEIGDHTGDTNNDHKCDKCGETLSECADADKDHKCDLCGAELSKCADADKNHKCDLCGAELSKCADADKNHKCDLCGAELSKCIDENKDYKCDICGAELEKPEDPEQPEKPVIEDVIRLAGANRWETSLKVADEMKANLGLEKFDSIIIASGNDFADALAGSYLSTVKNAPILLGWGKGGKYVTLDEANIAYIKANLAEGGTVYILGGKNAVPELYENELKGFKVVRLGGANRFETNLLILEEAGVNEGDEILVCTSTNFADSLSASATAKPILLVFNEYGKLYGKQPEFLAGLKNCTFTVIGGESAVSAKLFDAIKAYGTTTRLAGANRFETSVLVAQKYFASPETAVLAYAWNYPDGLCGGSLAYSLKAPLILTMTKYEAKAVEYAKNAGIEIGLVLGGDTLISDDAVRAIFAMDAAGEIVKK